MPTALPRYQITETPEVARALDLAAQRWPGEPRPKLLLRLIQAGASDSEQQAAADRRQQTVLRTSGTFPGVFASGYLADLRDDWPE